MEMSTRELIARFKQSEGYTEVMDNLFKVLPPEAFEEYEEKIGKQFLEMNEDESVGLILFLTKKTGWKPDSAMPRIVFVLRQMVDYYIINVKPIVSPIPRIIKNRNSMLAEVASNEFHLTEEYMNAIIGKLYRAFPNDFAEYTEMLILLFYEGIPSFDALVQVKEADFDDEKMVIHSNGMEHILSKRCAYLLKRHQEAEFVYNDKRKYYLIGWNGSLVKAIRKSEEPLDNLTKEEYKKILTLSFTRRVRSVTKETVNSRALYYLGFHDYIVSKIGAERASDLLNTYGSREASRELRDLADEYGVPRDNITKIRDTMVSIG